MKGNEGRGCDAYLSHNLGTCIMDTTGTLAAGLLHFDCEYCEWPPLTPGTWKRREVNDLKYMKSDGVFGEYMDFSFTWWTWLKLSSDSHTFALIPWCLVPGFKLCM